MKHQQSLKEAINSARFLMVENLKMFVYHNGNELTDYDINEFGLDEGRSDEERIIRVLNLFDNGGAYFTVQDRPNEEYPDFTFYAFQCLYIVERKNIRWQLKYYTFVNNGKEFDETNSEPDHDYVYKLPIDVLYNLYRAIISNQE